MTESNERKPMTFTCQQLAAWWCGPGKCPMWCGLGRCQPVFAARAAAPQAQPSEPALCVPIPVSAAQKVANEFGYDQVVIVARRIGGNEHVTTYGRNAAHCDVAARMGHFFKHKLMGWPEPQAQPATPAASEIKDLAPIFESQPATHQTPQAQPAPAAQPFVPLSMPELLRRVERARQFPVNTCPASRHVHLMACALAIRQPYAMLTDEPQHCAESMLYVLASLWEARTELERLARSPEPAPISDERPLQLLREVFAHGDDADGGDAPGHDHTDKGRWDGDGSPCEWCATWAKVRALLAEKGKP